MSACAECLALRARAEETARLSADLSAVWKETPAPESDALLAQMRQNIEHHWGALERYIFHVETDHHRRVESFVSVRDFRMYEQKNLF